jgi:hypothetical protein
MSKMKNFMDFKTFSVSESYYNDFSYFGKDRSTELGRKLERIRSGVKAENPNQKMYGDIVLGKLLSGLLGVGAAASDALGKSRGRKKEKKEDKEDMQKSFSEWSENLGPTTTEKDLEKFAKKSEEAAFKRYGKSWDYNNPKGAEQKKFADLIKKGESEIASKMKK